MFCRFIFSCFFFKIILENKLPPRFVVRPCFISF